MDPETVPPHSQEPSLKRNLIDPRGVIQKNLKALLYIGVAVIVVLALALSSFHKVKSPADAAKDKMQQPIVQDNTATNVEQLRQQVAADKVRQQQDAQMAAAAGTPTQQTAPTGYGATGQPLACPSGQYCPPPQGTATNGGQQPQLTPVQQQEQQLEAKERERQFTSRFESNLAYNRAAAEEQQRAMMPQQQQQLGADPAAQGAALSPGSGAAYQPYQTGPQTNFQQGREVGAPSQAQASALQNSAYKPGPEVNIDSAVGQPYVLYEGTTLDTVLMNRLDGDAPGPVKVLVSNPVYSHDHQHVIVPEGTIALGEAKKIGASGSASSGVWPLLSIA